MSKEPTSTSSSLGSKFSISIRQLSTPIPSIAESKCSMVRILNPSLERVVQRGDSSAKLIEAGITLDLKLKYLPAPASSGHNFTVETFPECRVFPVLSIHPARVCCSLPVCTSYTFLTFVKRMERNRKVA